MTEKIFVKNKFWLFSLFCVFVLHAFPSTNVCYNKLLIVLLCFVFRAECCLEYPESLPKLLQCVKWTNHEHVAQVRYLRTFCISSGYTVDVVEIIAIPVYTLRNVLCFTFSGPAERFPRYRGLASCAKLVMRKLIFTSLFIVYSRSIFSSKVGGKTLYKLILRWNYWITNFLI